MSDRRDKTIRLDETTEMQVLDLGDKQIVICVNTVCDQASSPPEGSRKPEKDPRRHA